MQPVLTLTAAIGLTFVSTATVLAREKPKRERLKAQKTDASFFDRLDVNKDGAITLDEIPAERRDRVAKLIERMDKNGDGKVTREEFETAIRRVRAQSDQPAGTNPANRPPEPPAAAERPPGDAQPPGALRPPGERTRLGATGRPEIGSRGPVLFRLLDANGDGKLSREELAKAVDVLMKLDRDGDGFLTPDELGAGFRPGVGPTSAGSPVGTGSNLAAGMFRRMDKNGDGKLSKDELPELMRDRFEQMDTNHDGSVDDSEFSQALETFRKLRGDSPDATRRPGQAVLGAREQQQSESAIEANRERIAAYFREHDKDVDGRISPSEFGTDRADEFKKLDLNGDGYLDPSELARGLPKGDSAGDRPRRDGQRAPAKERKLEER